MQYNQCHCWRCLVMSTQKLWPEQAFWLDVKSVLGQSHDCHHSGLGDKALSGMTDCRWSQQRAKLKSVLLFHCLRRASCPTLLRPMNLLSQVS